MALNEESTEVGNQPPSKRSLFGRSLVWVGSILLTFHCAAIIVSGLIPASSALYQRLEPPFHGYLNVLRLKQSWKLFHSIPKLHKMDARLELQKTDGTIEEFGPIVPGLKDYQGELRHLKLWLNFRNPRFAHYLRGYIRSAKRELGRQNIDLDGKLCLRIDVERTRPLNRIRKDGEKGKAESKCVTGKEKS